MNVEINKYLIVIITPIYEDNDASRRLFLDLAKEFKNKIYVVAVDDGSVKHPVDALNIKKAGLPGVVIRLKRNVGHQRAIAIGLSYFEEHIEDLKQVVVVMDSDGEDMPKSIRELIKLLDLQDVDLVVAKRKSRVETLRFRIFYSIYRKLFFTLSGQKISFGNFMALKPEAVKRLVSMQELWIHVAGCVLVSKLRTAIVAINRGPRYMGHSKMNFVDLVLHGFKGLMVFSENVLVRVGIACALVALMSILGIILAIALKLIGFATPGWFSVALGILLLIFLQTGALTLTTLMLTGVVKSGANDIRDYRVFIKYIEQV
jgi:glycosyltransferase involved in cell wall biosynthesis